MENRFSVSFTLLENGEDDLTDDLEDEVEDDGDDEDHDPVGDASADSSSLDEEEERQDHGCTTTPTFPSRNGWGSKRGPPGPHDARDVPRQRRSLDVPPVHHTEMMNRQGRRKYGNEWKGMDETDLCAYVGLLIFAGVYRSRGEGDTESGWAIFRATMPRKLFHMSSRLLRFDDSGHKLTAVREVWTRGWRGYRVSTTRGPK